MALRSSTAELLMTHLSMRKSPNCLTAYINLPMETLELRWDTVRMSLASSVPSTAGLVLTCFSLGFADSLPLAGALLGWGQSVHHWADHRDAAQQAEGDGWGRSEEAGGGLCHLCERDKKKYSPQSQHSGLSSLEPFSAKLIFFFPFHRCLVILQTQKDDQCLMPLRLQGWTVCD